MTWGSDRVRGEGRPDPVAEIHGFSVDQDHFHLGVRHPEGLDGVLHSGPAPTVMGKGPLPPPGWQEIVELLVKPEMGHHHGSNLSVQ